VAKSNPPSDDIDGGMPLSATVSQVVRSTGEAILSSDTSQDLLFDESESVRDSGINSLMCVPLVGDDVETLGLIQIGIKSSFVPFSHRDLDVLVNIASQVSLAIQKARLHQETLEHVRELQAEKDELERINEELQQFAYITSHDLQEPVRTISSFGKLLQEHSQDVLDPEAQDYLQETISGAERIRLLIDELLEYSRVGSRGHEFEQTDVNHVVNVVIANLNAAIEESAAVLTCDELPTIMGDSTQLTQLFQNLISNAIKFRSDRTPEIHISAEQTDDSWNFSIRDNGIGINNDYLDRIFIIFRRLHARDEFSGTGMGLAICKRIAERHGGQIWAESQEGQGSTFFVSIPSVAQDSV
jgi:light-regulated signal transduction histidine kinase (bacteriophytochrome)